MKKFSIVAIVLMLFGQSYAQNTNNKNPNKRNTTSKTEHYTFQLSDKVTRQKVTFKNRYGIMVTGDLYLPVRQLPCTHKF